MGNKSTSPIVKKPNKTVSKESSLSSSSCVDFSSLGMGENESSFFYTMLPLEVKYEIFSVLPVADLLCASLVCKEFYLIIGDDRLWKKRFEEERLHWNVFTNSVGFKKNNFSYGLPKYDTFSKEIVQTLQTESIYNKKEKEKEEELEINKSSSSWKRLYLYHFKKNIQEVPKPSKRGDISESGIPDSFNTSLTKPDIQFIMFGEGNIKGTAKQLLYEMMWNENSPFEMNGMYPGVEGIGSSVGFKIEDTATAVAALHLGKYFIRKESIIESDKTTDSVVDEDELNPSHVFESIGEEGMPSVWKNFCRSAGGLIYCMNSAEDDVDAACFRLRAFLQLIVDLEDQLEDSTVHIPLLVFLCNSLSKSKEDDSEELSDCDISKLPSIPTIRPAVLGEQLVFNEVQKRRWCVRNVNCETLVGVYEGLQWLLQSCNLHD